MEPQTRQEKKGKKNKEKNPYSAKHVRMQEALREQRAQSSASKTPPSTTSPSLWKK